MTAVISIPNDCGDDGPGWCAAGGRLYCLSYDCHAIVEVEPIQGTVVGIQTPLDFKPGHAWFTWAMPVLCNGVVYLICGGADLVILEIDQWSHTSYSIYEWQQCDYEWNCTQAVELDGRICLLCQGRYGPQILIFDPRKRKMTYGTISGSDSLEVAKLELEDSEEICKAGGLIYVLCHRQSEDDLCHLLEIEPWSAALQLSLPLPKGEFPKVIAYAEHVYVVQSGSILELKPGNHIRRMFSTNGFRVDSDTSILVAHGRLCMFKRDVPSVVMFDFFTGEVRTQRIPDHMCRQAEQWCALDTNIYVFHMMPDTLTLLDPSFLQEALFGGNEDGKALDDEAQDAGAADLQMRKRRRKGARDARDRAEAHQSKAEEAATLAAAASAAQESAATAMEEARKALAEAENKYDAAAREAQRKKEEAQAAAVEAQLAWEEARRREKEELEATVEERHAEAVAQAREEAESRIAEAQQETVAKQNQAAWVLLSHLPDCSLSPQCGRKSLPGGDPRWCLLQRLVQESCARHRRRLRDKDFCPAPKLKVLSISLTFNPELTALYLGLLKQVHRLRDGVCSRLQDFAHLLLPSDLGDRQLNEHLLFHGAPNPIVEEICASGFDVRRGGEGAGRAFGLGTYFAANASKADIYTQDRTNPAPRGGERKLIVARVLMGESFRCLAAMPQANRPPNGPYGRPYDSVWADIRANGGCVDHLEAVVYKDAQAIPVAIVTYKHLAECACAECRKRPP